MHRLPLCHQLVLVVLLLIGGQAAATDDAPGSAKLQRLMEQTRARAAQLTASAASASSPSPSAALPSAPRMQERTQLLARAEAALAQMDSEKALTAFENAANILHSADTEMGIVRTYMQMGNYRQALAFGAHTAGAHLDEVGGSALYAWLLHAGGQAAVAHKLLAQTQARVPQHALVSAVQQQLQSTAPLATGIMLRTPVRMAPQGTVAKLPASTQVISSGLLINQGRRVIVPLHSLTGTSRTQARLWVRNGLGQLSSARLVQKLPGLGLAVLQLPAPLPLQEPLVVTAADGFAGSVAYAMEYVPSHDATPRWPVLHSGFLGSLSNPTEASDPSRELGLALGTGPRGGPVFDSAGYLAGIAIPQPGKADHIVMSSRLRQQLGSAWGLVANPALPRPQASVDKVYEAGLRNTVQLLVGR